MEQKKSQESKGFNLQLTGHDRAARSDWQKAPGVADGKKTKRPVGRPRVTVPPADVKLRRDAGLSWRQLSRELGIGTATAMRLYQLASRTIERPQGPSAKKNIHDSI